MKCRVTARNGLEYVMSSPRCFPPPPPDISQNESPRSGGLPAPSKSPRSSWRKKSSPGQRESIYRLRISWWRRCPARGRISRGSLPPARPLSFHPLPISLAKLSRILAFPGNISAHPTQTATNAPPGYTLPFQGGRRGIFHFFGCSIITRTLLTKKVASFE